MGEHDAGSAMTLHDESVFTGHGARDDLIVGMRSVRIWATLGWHDIRQRYRRSVIGPFWFTLSTAVMVVVLGVVYSNLLRQEIRDYLPYLAIGLVIWGYLSSVANEGCNAFIGAAYLIKQIRMPLTIHVCRIAWRNFVILLHSLPVVLLLLFFFGRGLSAEYLLIPFGLFLLLLHGIWVGIVLGILCARYRDISPIVVNLVQIVFFFTPVMWSPEILKQRTWIAEFNPLYHVIETIRAPILGRAIHWESWGWSLGLLVAGFAFSQYLMLRARNRVAYWL